jgi:macrolide transport system ATP-binding/permease protein
MAHTALIATDLVRTYGRQRVLDGVNLTIAPGRRVGLIGENGVGKSTLLRILAGLEPPDAGTVQRPDELGFLQQELSFEPGLTVRQIVDDAVRDSHELLARLDRAAQQLSERPGDERRLSSYGELLERAQDGGAWDVDRRADLVLTGLGIASIPRARRLNEISGGQRSRLALAVQLIRRPSAMLLDEPTNHLDDAAAAFLEDQLRGLDGIVIAASHDRAFLDAVCTDLLDLDPGPDDPIRYGGNYSAYQQDRRAARDRRERQYAEEQDELSALRHSVNVTARQVAPDRPPRDNEKMGYGHAGGRVQNQISRRVQNSARRLAELERSQIRKPREPLHFRAPVLTVAGADGTAVALRGIEVAGRLWVGHLDIASDAHLLVTGPNGAGKTTLFNVIAGYSSAGGSILRRSGLRIRYLAQDSVFEFSQRTVQETYLAALGVDRAEVVPLRTLGLVAPRDLATTVGALSVGQRRRLALAIVLANPPDLLLLDEPTNHLSPLLADELQDAFDAAPGALVVASHDRWLRERWKGEILQLPMAGQAAS